ncbi:MAG: histone deacetylase family protein [Alphaproteobacteria bacterium]|jgi:acetoin utilization deacetylase AcuC-like enzyme|nr:histone deacetylase family protein [Alphaproteobacteria bacterium]MDP6517677.1 histone deacetylase family protein [Alphaproteobacteria bacterium]
MTTLLFTHPACLDHDPGDGHPERADRLRAVLAALDDQRFAALDRRQAPRATVAQIARAHDRAYVESLLERAPVGGRVQLDADTVMSPGSVEAALRAAGALCAAVDAVVAGDEVRAFCAVRPPGHHAEPSRPMGFCLFNNVAIGAEQARAVHGLARVAIVDFDVHHGNGTQAIFAREPMVHFFSSHQMPLYPGTGAASETGVGNILNMPLAMMTGGDEFRRVWGQVALPRLREFDPDLILISAGFDGHRDDPLAQLQLIDDDYGWLTRELVAIARQCCAGRMVSTLEGGYDLAALGVCATAHVAALMDP